MDKINPISVGTQGFTTNVKKLREDVETLDQLEDMADLGSNSKEDIEQLKKELDALSDAAKNMEKDIERKYFPPPPSPSGGGGCCY